MEENKHTLAVLQVCDRLVEFGAFGTKDEIKEVLKPMVKLLNGVTDLTKKDEELDKIDSVRRMLHDGFREAPASTLCVSCPLS